MNVSTNPAQHMLFHSFQTTTAYRSASGSFHPQTNPAMVSWLPPLNSAPYLAYLLSPALVEHSKSAIPTGLMLSLREKTFRYPLTVAVQSLFSRSHADLVGSNCWSISHLKNQLLPPLLMQSISSKPSARWKKKTVKIPIQSNSGKETTFQMMVVPCLSLALYTGLAGSRSPYLPLSIAQHVLQNHLFLPESSQRSIFSWKQHSCWSNWFNHWSPIPRPFTRKIQTKL